MLAEIDVASDGDGNRVLEMRADGEHGRQLARDAHGERRIASSTAEHALAAAGDAHHRVIDGPGDGAVVSDEEVGHIAEAVKGFAVVDANGVAAQVAAGGDDGMREGAEQQVMERRVRQHDAVEGGCFADVCRETLGAGGLEEDDGRRGGAEQAFLGGRHAAIAAHGLEVRHHDRERFLVAMFAVSQAGDGNRVASIGQELESADTFQGDDAAAPQGFGRVRDGDIEARAAHGAGDGLRVEAAVERVGVLGEAGGAQLEVRERGVRAVVRDVADDGVAGTAAGAVGEGIAVAALAGR